MNNNFLVLICAAAEFLSMAVLCHDAQRLPPGVNPTQYQGQPHQHQQQQQQYQQYQPPPPQQQQQQQQQPQQQQQQQRTPPPPQQQQQQQVPLQQGQGQQPQQRAHHHDPNAAPQQLLDAANIAQEIDHIQEHLHVPVDTSKMSEQELQFHYFKMHDADNNNKLDGCELIKSLIHWHVEHGQLRIFTDEELVQLIDASLLRADLDNDGYISYTEYVIEVKNAAERQKEEQQQMLLKQQQMQQEQLQNPQYVQFNEHQPQP